MLNTYYGYNTMSDEERKKFDIENYLVFLKPFLNSNLYTHY